MMSVLRLNSPRPARPAHHPAGPSNRAAGFGCRTTAGRFLGRNRPEWASGVWKPLCLEGYFEVSVHEAGAVGREPQFGVGEAFAGLQVVDLFVQRRGDGGTAA